MLTVDSKVPILVSEINEIRQYGVMANGIGYNAMMDFPFNNVMVVAASSFQMIIKTKTYLSSSARWITDGAHLYALLVL